MSREIKFRAWDEEAEQMFYSQETESDYFFEFMDGKLRGFAVRPPRPSSDPMEPPEPYCNDYPVMQFTGLRDKNGKEIFEADILTPYAYRKTKDFNGLVIFKKAMFCFQEDKKLYQTLKSLCESFKLAQAANNPYIVIGNIHENPELIKSG